MRAGVRNQNPGSVAQTLAESPACALQEVEYFEKMEVRDFHNDILLAEACRTDVDAHCKKAKRGASPPQRDTI